MKNVRPTGNVPLMVLLFLMHFGLQLTVAQNLVLNPSFEEIEQCPEDFGTFENDVPHWSCPTNGSTDYFNSCSTKMPLRRNFAGSQNAYHGKGYAGFYAYGPKDYREYISGQMQLTLEKDKKYIVSVRISLSEKSAYAVQELGFLFGQRPLKLGTTRNIPYRLAAQMKGTNYLSLRDPNYYAVKEDWIELSKEYVAEGTERYLTFGNFKENRKTQILSTGEHLKKAAYYFVDMISIVQVDRSFNLDEVYVFDGLNFDVDGFHIQSEFHEKLQSLIHYLKENPTLNIAIYGHTDNVGSKEYNLKLSDKRARTVSAFLIQNGLSPFRISWRGYGDKNPIAANTSEEDRERNRRVEFVISKNDRTRYASGHFEEDNDE